MATQKVGLTKLGLKKNTNLVSLEWNGQVIEIKEYLPIEDKMQVIEQVVNASLDSNNYANPINIHLNFILEIIFAYTDINFTDKQKENKFNLYNLFVSSGLWNKIKENINKDDLDLIYNSIYDTIHEFYKYKDSVLGVLDSVNQDYNGLMLDAENIQKNLADPSNLSLLKDVITKLG